MGESLPPPSAGLLCPVCHTLLDRVLFTRKVAGQILRVRKCPRPECRRRVRTAERIVSTNASARDEGSAA